MIEPLLRNINKDEYIIDDDKHGEKPYITSLSYIGQLALPTHWGQY